MKKLFLLLFLAVIWLGYEVIFSNYRLNILEVNYARLEKLTVEMSTTLLGVAKDVTANRRMIWHVEKKD